MMSGSLATAALFGAVGLLIGPLCGILVDRVPERVRLKPVHRCGNCSNDHGAMSLVPVFSWFGVCTDCAYQRWWPYGATDLLVAGLAALVGYKFGLSVESAPYMFLAIVCGTLTVIDIRTHLLPNPIVWPSIFATVGAVAVCHVVGVEALSWSGATAGSFAFFGFLFLSFLIYPKGMGLGDVKLAIVLGAHIGWIQSNALQAMITVLWALLISTAVAGIAGVTYNAIRKEKAIEIPFGPYLVAASFLVIMAS